MKKAALRKLYKQRRNDLTTIERQSFDLLLLQQLKSFPIPFFKQLLSYYPIEKHNEPNTLLFNNYLRTELPGLKICKPRINDQGGMDAIMVDERTQYQHNELDIPEPIEDKIVSPSAIEAVFVPLLAYDRKGYRVGYGKGFYDKYLSLCAPTIIKIGFSYFEPEDIIEDRNDYDLPLTLCFTPFEVYEF